MRTTSTGARIRVHNEIRFLILLVIDCSRIGLFCVRLPKHQLFFAIIIQQKLSESQSCAEAMEIAQYLVIIRAKFPYIAWANIILPTNELNPLAETTQFLSKMLTIASKMPGSLLSLTLIVAHLLS